MDKRREYRERMRMTMVEEERKKEQERMNGGSRSINNAGREAAMVSGIRAGAMRLANRPGTTTPYRGEESVT